MLAVGEERCRAVARPYTAQGGETVAGLSDDLIYSNGWPLGTLMAMNPHIPSATQVLSKADVVCLPAIYNRFQAEHYAEWLV